MEGLSSTDDSDVNVLEQRVRHLEAELQRSLNIAQSLALRNGEHAPQLEAELEDTNASLSSVREVNKQLENEILQCKNELGSTSAKLKEEEGNLAEKERALSRLRCKIFEEKHREVNYEGRIREEHAAQDALSQDLKTALGKQVVVEMELLGVQHTFHDKSLWRREPAAAATPTTHAPQSSEPPLKRLVKQQSAKRARLYSTKPDVWGWTPHLTPPCVIARQPPPSMDLIQRAQASHRNHFSSSRGVIFRDDQIDVGLVTRKASEGPLSFEIGILNHTTHPIQQLLIQPLGPGLRLEGQHHGTVWPRQCRRYQGYLESSVDDIPSVEITYQQSDGLQCSTRLMLPLGISHTMEAARLEGDHFMKLWNSVDFEQGEVCFVCAPRAGPTRIYQKSLELGGALCSLPYLSEGPELVPLAGVCMQRGKKEVLARVEFKMHDALCRVTIRTALYSMSRALAKILLVTLANPSLQAAQAAAAGRPLARPARSDFE